MTPSPASAPAPSHWPLRAAAAGILACALGAALCISRYLTLPGALRLNWSTMLLALTGFVLTSGAVMGLCVGGTTLRAARRGARVGGLTLAGALGGAIAGLLPGLLGIAGFGSLSAPYAGTANILSAILVGAITFVALWSPLLQAPRPGRSWLGHLARCTSASVISLGAFGMMSWTVLQALDLVPSFDTLVAVTGWLGLVPASLVVGAALGAGGGAAVGAACGLVEQIERE